MLDTELRRVLDGPAIAHLATVLPDGAPHSTPVYVGTHGDHIVLFTGPHTRKARNLRRDPRLALSIAPADNPFAPVAVRGRVVDWITGPEAWTVVDRLVAKYTDIPYPRDGERWVAVIAPNDGPAPRASDPPHVDQASSSQAPAPASGSAAAHGSRIRRFDHVGVTVADLEATTEFFVRLGLQAQGAPMAVEGEFLDTVIGIPDSRTRIVMLAAPDGGTTLELSSFERPDHQPGAPDAMANELGLRNVAFEVDDLDATLDRLAADGYGLVGGVGQYEQSWRMAYVRGPEGIIVSLAQRVH
ncbi:TIGR03618 family F420-dependent PPOX class oxidoreductase [Actinomadura barringtoniae]|uniref:TIGR03618 family F420-dependent PPOX class oxidoreductase n=1 Tax=Actinomadura barringtoniae TaxID=1427535 RepID=A0A939T906_9ACTN|nr:TIGR03618 family F420-dependent PPOX class oxidoreductase [Actinomadura barringtoniae]MBO2450892.1 TIGR03618 family F420-dependent PPOX class oxidoreductase [Actinomadura barringtoniae]